MKKYSSYFNKRYFPEPDENTEEETLPVDLLADADSVSDEPLTSAEVTNAPTVDTASYKPVVSESVTYSTPVANYSAPAAETPAVATGFGGYSNTYTAPPVVSAPAMPTAPAATSEPEVTIISKSAVISGELTVAGDMRMYGKIKGNMNVQGNIEIAGKVIGNVSGNDIELSRCELKGDISSTGFVFMDKESIMIGNLSSQDITLDGKVKGDLAANNKIYIRSNAIIVGNVRATTIAIDEGASLQGQVIIATKENTDLKIGDEGSDN